MEIYRLEFEPGDLRILLSWEHKGPESAGAVGFFDWPGDPLVLAPLSDEFATELLFYNTYLDQPEALALDVITSESDQLFVVSQKFRDVVEKFDPHEHQFFEIPRIRSLADGQQFSRRYYALNVHFTKETVDLDQSNAAYLRRRDDGMGFWFLRSLTRESCVTHEKIAAAPALWRDSNTCVLFVTDQLMSALQEAGCTGIRFI